MMLQNLMLLGTYVCHSHSHSDFKCCYGIIVKKDTKKGNGIGVYFSGYYTYLSGIALFVLTKSKE